MKGPRRIGLRLLALAPILLALVLLAPLGAQASGELVIKEYISKDVVQVGETVTFGQGEPPVSGMVVRWNFGDGSPEVTGWPVLKTLQWADHLASPETPLTPRQFTTIETHNIIAKSSPGACAPPIDIVSLITPAPYAPAEMVSAAIPRTPVGSFVC